MCPAMMDNGSSILQVMRAHMSLSIGEMKIHDADGHDVWRIDATDAKGERWVATDESFLRKSYLPREATTRPSVCWRTQLALT